MSKSCTVLSIDVGIHRIGFVLGMISPAWFTEMAHTTDEPSRPRSTQAKFRELVQGFVVPIHAENIDLVKENGFKISKAKQIGPMNTVLGCYHSFMRRLRTWSEPPRAIVVEIQDATNAFMRQTSTAMMGILVGHFHAVATSSDSLPDFYMVRGSHKMEVCRQVLSLWTPLQRSVIENQGRLPNTALERPTYTSWTVARLKDALKKYKLPVSGTRATLLARLDDFHRKACDQAIQVYTEHQDRRRLIEELSPLTRKDLEARLKARGLSRTGKKADLIDRLAYTSKDNAPVPEDRASSADEDFSAHDTNGTRKRPRKENASFIGRFPGRFFAAQKKKRRSAYESRKTTSVDAVHHWQQCRVLQDDIQSFATTFDSVFDSLSEHDKRDVADAWWQCVHILAKYS